MKIILLTILLGLLTTSFAVTHRQSQNRLTSLQHDNLVDSSINNALQALLQTTPQYTPSVVRNTLVEIKNSYEVSLLTYETQLGNENKTYELAAMGVRNKITSFEQQINSTQLLIDQAEISRRTIETELTELKELNQKTDSSIDAEIQRRSQAESALETQLSRMNSSLNLTEEVLTLMHEIQDNENGPAGGQSLLEKNRKHIQTKLDAIEERASGNSGSLTTTIKNLLEATQSTQSIAGLIANIISLVNDLKTALSGEKNAAIDADKRDAEYSKKLIDDWKAIADSQERSILTKQNTLKEINDDIVDLNGKIDSYRTDIAKANTELGDLTKAYKAKIAPIEGEIEKLNRYIYSLNQALKCLEGGPVDETDEEEEPEEEEPTEEEPEEEEEPEPQFESLRIAVDFEQLTEGTEEFKTYFKTELVPAVLSYFQNALKYKYRVTQPIKFNKTRLEKCGRNTPQALINGVDNADIFIFFGNIATGNAENKHCEFIDGRPYVTNIRVAYPYFNVTKDPLRHDRQITILAHEVFHALGLDGGSFRGNFVDKKGNKIPFANYSKKYLYEPGNVSITIWDFEPLTTRLRNYYNCPSLPGMFLGYGAHWDFRYYTFSVMAGADMQEIRITEFDLAFLESTGWYVVDYNYADPYWFGKGAGCDFFYKSLDPQTYKKEYCTEDEKTQKIKGCTAMGLSAGKCSSDSSITLENRLHFPDWDFHCQNPSFVSLPATRKKEVYGRFAGSRCFEGNIGASETSNIVYCFTYDCVTEGEDTTLYVIVGTDRVPCTAEGNATVPGYNNRYLRCPDPVQFCNTIGKPSCLRNCLGRGTCVQGKCECQAGFQGLYCERNATPPSA